MNAEEQIAFCFYFNLYEQVNPNGNKHRTDIIKNSVHIFRIEPTVSELFLKTKATPNINLPYDNLYITQETTFYDSKDVLTIYSRDIHLVKSSEGLIMFSTMIYNISEELKHLLEIIGPNCFSNDKQAFLFCAPLNINDSLFKKNTFFHWFSYKMANYIYNFLDFLNTPEIEIVETTRTPEQNAKRVKRGKIALPTIHNIRVIGKLKKYIDILETGGHFKYSHRFWVRGHFRELKSNRYKDKKKQWIYPYIKGNGILINKQYNIETN